MDETMESPIIANLPRGHRMDRQLGVVFDTAPAHADDLTRIDGVRTREAVLLNQLGIYLFGQVALWRHREIMVISSELQVPVSRIVDEGWTEQARQLSRPPALSSASNLPAPVLRMVVLLACTLLIGLFTVYLLGQFRSQPLTGVLSADITSIRVPAPSRMTAVHVKAGDEVFSGQPLLTLEKLEHLALIETQERLVVDMGRELKRVEAQAVVEAEWRTRDIDRELSGLRLEIAQAESLSQGYNRALSAGSSRFGNSVSPISSRYTVAATNRPRTGGILFFSGASGKSTPVPVEPALQSVPVRMAQAPQNGVMSDSGVLTSKDTQLDSLRTEQSRLETVRATLPTTISEALGVSTLKANLDDVTEQLQMMKSVSREINVQAPVYGVVGQVRYRKGDDLPEGEIMLRILHTDRRYIIVHLPTRRVAELHPGHEVALVFPGDQQSRGQVVDVPMLADTTGQPAETLAAVRIEPIGPLWPIVPVGSQVDVISLR